MYTFVKTDERYSGIYFYEIHMPNGAFLCTVMGPIGAALLCDELNKRK